MVVRIRETQAEYEERVMNEALNECLACDPVARAITYVRFVSKSKGRDQHGHKIKRRHWKEVRLVKYTDGFHSWRNFQFDVYATEIMGEWATAELLREAIIRLWGY